VCFQYTRWSCPQDVGYSCSNALGSDNPLFFGDPDRLAPCTQQSAEVVWLLTVFYAALPAFVFCLSIVFLRAFPLTRDVRAEIACDLPKRMAGQTVYDPVAQRALVPRDGIGDTIRDVFAAHEVQQLMTASSDAAWRVWMVKRTALSVACLLSLIWGSLQVSRVMLPLGMLVVMCSFAGITWNALKLAHLWDARAGVL